jgi:hypothetical protein
LMIPESVLTSRRAADSGDQIGNFSQAIGKAVVQVSVHLVEV